jgi:hypothetical protein
MLVHHNTMITLMQADSNLMMIPERKRKERKRKGKEKT